MTCLRDMQISQITLEGLTMTGMPFCQKFLLTMHISTNTAKSFIEMTRFLLSKMNSDRKEKAFLLSERVSQDTVENYFAKQRARGGRNDN